jgi:hypothetical protein
VTDNTAGASVRALLSNTVAALTTAGAPDEALGILKPSKGFSIFRTADVIRPAGRAWRLGVLLLDASGRLYSRGDVTRAIEPGRAATNRSAAGEERRAYRLAASRGGFPYGEVVNYGHLPIAVDDAALAAGSGPLFVRDGDVFVRWDASTADLGVTRLDAYLADRMSLLVGE